MQTGTLMGTLDNVRVNAGGAVIDTNGFNATINSALLDNGGGGGLVKNSAGTLTLTANNTYTGTTVINAGTLEVGSGGGTGELGSGNVTNNGALVINRTGSIAIGGNISGSGTLTKNAAGTLTLTGNNSYGGQTTVNAGAINIQSNSALGTTAGGTTVASGAQLELQGNLNVAGEALTISGGGDFFGALQSVSGDSTWSGGVLLGANDTRIGTKGSAALRISGVIDDGVNSFNLLVRNQTSTGVVELSGANTYGGSTNVIEGVLRLAGGNDRLPTGTTLNLGSTSAGVFSPTFDLNGNSQTLAGLNTLDDASDNVAAVVNTGAGAATLTINNSATNTFNGTISSSAGNLHLVHTGSASLTLGRSISGNVSLTQSGAGTAALGGNGNSHTGLTTVENGTLALNTTAGNAIGGNLTIQNGGKVTFGGSHKIADSANVVMSGASSVFNGTGVNVGAAAISETIASLTVTGGSFSTGTSTWIVDGAASFTGGASTIFVGNSGSNSTFNSLSLTGMTATAGGTVATNDSFTLYGGGATKSTITVGPGGLSLNNSRINLRRGATGHAGSRLVLNGSVTTTGTGASFITEDTAGGTVGTRDLELSGSAAAVNRIFDIGGGGADLTIGVRITNGASSQAGIVKNGAGKLTLTNLENGGASGFTGGVTINAGTVSVSDSLHFGQNNSPGVTINGGSLEITGTTFNSSKQFTLNNATSNINVVTGPATISGLLTGTGGLGKQGTGVLILTNTSNDYAGATTISSGTLRLGAAGVLPNTTDVTITSPGILDLNGQAESIDGLAGNGTVTSGIAGAVTFTVGASNTAGARTSRASSKTVRELWL